MKSLFMFFLLLTVVSCASAPLATGPDIWQYDDDKFISFKESVELSWEYDDASIDYFEIDREKVEIEDDDLLVIKKLVEDADAKKLAEIERKYREKINYDNIVTRYPLKDERSFADKEEPLPAFGEICFYRLYAVDQPGSDKSGAIKSDPAELSVIILSK